MQTEIEAIRVVTQRLQNGELGEIALLASQHENSKNMQRNIRGAARTMIDTMFAEGHIDYPAAAFKLLGVNISESGSLSIGVRFRRDEDQIGLLGFKADLGDLVRELIDPQDRGDNHGELMVPIDTLVDQVGDLYKRHILANRIPIQ